MKIVKRNDAFARCVNERYALDTDITCAVCGYGIYADDTIEFNEHSEICHEECLREEYYEQYE